MPKSYLICDVEHFYEKDDYLLPIQENMFEYEGEAEIKFKKKNGQTSFYKNFVQYSCHHDYKHKRFGKAFNRTFSYYFEPVDFNMYFNKDKKLLLIQTKTDVSLDYIQKLNSTKLFNISPIKIDFTSMYPLIPEVSGAWIADLKRTYLRTAGYFGPNVNKDEEFKKAAEEGEVSALQMRYISQTTREEFGITISKKGSIVLHETFNTIEDELELVLDIYDKLINIKTPA